MNLVRARARGRYGDLPRTLRHRVLVNPSGGPAEAAICGFRPVLGWVLEPTITRDCTRCFKEEK